MQAYVEMDTIYSSVNMHRFLLSALIYMRKYLKYRRGGQMKIKEGIAKTTAKRVLV